MKVVFRGRMPRPGRGRPDFDRLGRGADRNHQIIPSATVDACEILQGYPMINRWINMDQLQNTVNRWYTSHYLGFNHPFDDAGFRKHPQYEMEVLKGTSMNCWINWDEMG